MAKPGLESRLPACNLALLPPSVCRSPLLPTPLHPPTQVASMRQREERGPGRILFYSGRVICFRQWQVPAGPFPKSPLTSFPYVPSVTRVSGSQESQRAGLLPAAPLLLLPFHSRKFHKTSRCEGLLPDRDVSPVST